MAVDVITQAFLDAGWTVDANGLFTPGTQSDVVAAPTVEQPNTFTATTGSIVNTVSVAIAPTVPTTLAAAPAGLAYVTAVDSDSVAQFGTQATPIVVTLLETIADAELLAKYLIRDIPAYWFTNFKIEIGALTAAQRTVIAQLEIGDQIRVTKTFPAGVTPTSVTQSLFVEGIDHELSPSGHTVIVWAGPAEIYDQFILGSATAGVLGAVAYGLG